MYHRFSLHSLLLAAVCFSCANIDDSALEEGTGGVTGDGDGDGSGGTDPTGGASSGGASSGGASSGGSAPGSGGASSGGAASGGASSGGASSGGASSGGAASGGASSGGAGSGGAGSGGMGSGGAGTGGGSSSCAPAYDPSSVFDCGNSIAVGTKVTQDGIEYACCYYAQVGQDPEGNNGPTCMSGEPWQVVGPCP